MANDSGCPEGCITGASVLPADASFVPLSRAFSMDSHRRPVRGPVRPGLTLIELMAVVAILAILAGAMVPLVSRYAAQARTTAARASLAAVRDAIMGTPDKPGFLADTGRLPTSMAELFLQPTDVSNFNRDTGLGWRGPYLLNATGVYPVNDAYGQKGDPALLDPWGQPIVLQIPNQTSSRTPTTATAADLRFARLVSGGPNGTIDTLQNATSIDVVSGNSFPYPPLALRHDDIVLFVQHSDSIP